MGFLLLVPWFLPSGLLSNTVVGALFRLTLLPVKPICQDWIAVSACVRCLKSSTQS